MLPISTRTEPLRTRSNSDLLLGVGIGVADGGDLLARDAARGQLVDDLVIDAVTPGRRVDAHVAEDHLRAAGGGGLLPDGGDVVGQGVDLRAGEILGRGRQQPGVEGQLAAVGGDGQGVILAGIDLLRPQPVVAGDQLLLERWPAPPTSGRRRRCGLPPSSVGPGQVEHLRRLHVGERPEHLLQFGQVDEAGEAAAGPAASAPSGEISMRVDHLAEGGGPAVEMLDAAALQPLRVEEALHRVELDHRVGNRRAGGEGHAVAGMLLAQVAGFHVEVEGPLAAAGLDAGDALHLGRRLQVLEIMGLVDEDVIDAQLVEHQPVILLVLGEQVFQPLLAAGLLLLDGLDDVAAACLPPAWSRSNWSYSSICSRRNRSW